MGSTDEQPASELVADLLDTARASRTRMMQEVTGAPWAGDGRATSANAPVVSFGGVLRGQSRR